MFIGREKELAQLESLYADGSFHLSFVYGRRRVGKSSLLREFSSRKDCIYFSALETCGQQNRTLFLNLVKKYKLPLSENAAPVLSMEEILTAIFEHSLKNHFILILDDYQFLSKGEKTLSATLTRLISHYQESSHLLLILCNSSLPLAEKEFLSEKSPLKNQSALCLHLKPFSFFECRKFFKKISSLDLACIYGMTGGIPDYLQLINERASVEENIKTLFLTPSSRLFEEPATLLRQEVREPALYNAILSAIANGATKLSEIAAVINEETSVCAAYLRNMILLEIVQKETPVTESSAKKTIYRIIDPVFRFWYRFLPDLLSDISQGKTDYASRQLSAQLPAYMTEVFEEICRQYLTVLEDSGKTPFAFEEIGKWWGLDPFTREKLNIQIMATDTERVSMLFASCKWSSEKMDVKELSALLQQSEQFSCKNRYYYLFSRNGFTRNCQDTAARYGNVTLVSFSK